MIKKALLCVVTTMSVLSISFFAFNIEKKQTTTTHLEFNTEIDQIESMPILENDEYYHLVAGGNPIEQRDQQFAKWLSAGLKIQVSNSSGSGTIIYFDPNDGYAYVQSCGHLWSGNMTAEEGSKRNVNCRVITWYQNEKKLTKPKSFQADVLFYSNIIGRDCSLLRFKPDWIPNYFPIAPSDLTFKTNTRFHSIGCDFGEEIAHYDVRFIGMQEGGGSNYPEFTTTENSPRPGRSGGGLLTDDYYVGICVRTTNKAGLGNGLFTPLKTIREYNAKNGYGWLNDVGINIARRIPIVDRNNPQGVYPKDYIPLPQN